MFESRVQERSLFVERRVDRTRTKIVVFHLLLRNVIRYAMLRMMPDSIWMVESVEIVELPR